MAKFSRQSTDEGTLRKWAAMLKGLNFVDNMQQDVRLTDLVDKHGIQYDSDDKLWKNILLLDWSIDQGTTNLHDDNIAQTGVTQHEGALSIDDDQIVTTTVDFADPTYGASGGTFGSVTTTYARYIRIDNLVWVVISFFGTAGTTPNYLTWTLPFTTRSIGAVQRVPAYVDDVGSDDRGGHFQMANNSTQCRVYMPLQELFSDGTVTVTNNFVYETQDL